MAGKRATRWEVDGNKIAERRKINKGYKTGQTRIKRKAGLPERKRKKKTRKN
jgi:hypothetical protein